MRKIIGLFLLLFSINGYCEWTKVTTGNSSVHYVDFSTTKKIGSYLRVWDLIDYVDKTSEIALSDIDCDQERTRVISITKYSGPMATGTSRSLTSKTPEWVYEIPNTTGHFILRRVCRK
jgi:hypothetical protein